MTSLEEWQSDEEELGFFLTIETLMGKPILIFVYPHDTLDLLKTRISSQEGIPKSEQTILLGETVLNEPYKSLVNLGLTEESNLKLITNMSTGAAYSRGLREPSPTICLSMSDLWPFSSPSKSSRGPVSSIQDMLVSYLQAQRFRDDSDSEEEEIIQGALIFRDRKLFLILKKDQGNEEWERQKYELLHGDKDNLPSISLMDETEEVTDSRKPARGDSAAQLDRMKENARMHEKMSQLRQKMLLRKQKDKEPLELPKRPKQVGEMSPPVTLKPFLSTTATSTKSTATSARSTVPSTKSTATSTRSIAPSTKSTATSTRSSVPSTRATAPSTRSTGPFIRSAAPSAKSTVPSTKSTGPSTKSTGPSTRSAAPSAKSTMLSTKSTGPSTRSAAPSAKSTILSTKSTGPSTRSAVPSAKSTILSTKSTGPSTRSAAPSAKSTILSTKSTGPSTRSAAPSTKSTGPSTRSAAPSAKSTIPSTKSTGPSTKSAAPSTKSAAPSAKSTIPSKKSTGPSTKSAAPSTKSAGPPI